MNSDNYTNYNVDEIMHEIRKELTKRKINDININNEFCNDGFLSFHSAAHLASSQFKLPPLNLYQPFIPKENGEYHISEFLHYHKEEFVNNAYIAMLGREGDTVGLNIFLKRLDRGMSKIEVLGRMRYSLEGRKKGIKIRGLLAPLTVQMIYKIPVLGYLCRLGISLLRLHKALRDCIDLEYSLLYQNKIFQVQLNQNFEAIDNEFIKLSKVIAEQEHNLNMLIGNLNTMTKKFNEKIDDSTEYVNQAMNVQDDRITLVETHMSEELDNYNDLMGELKESMMAKDVLSDNRVKELGESVKRWGEALKRIESKKAEKEELLQLAEQKAGRDETYQIQDDIKEILNQIHDNKLNILDQHRRLKFLLEETRKRFPKLVSRKQANEMVKEEDHLLDAMYVSLEDRFRGTRETIITLMKEYLPCIKGCKAGTTNAPILDIGCGRGEWLELCKQEGLKASGVDINNVMIAQCSKLGFDVTQTDAIQFLKNQDPNKFGAITGFHFIEHIENAERIAFFDEALRALKPGGVVIFETPNPENLTVGAFSFYIDPTHIKPLVPDTMQFILEKRGFVNVEIKRMHKNKAYYQKKTDNEFKNKYFFNEMDYAVIGYKK